VRKPPLSPADSAYERVREICLAFPAAEEKLSHGAPSFHVRGKMFLTFVDNHHGDGRIAVWCKCTPDEQRRLVATHSNRLFVPPYVGVKGWLGVPVDGASADFVELAILVEEAWRSVAPPRIVRGEILPSTGTHVPASPRVRTDARVASEALERLTVICLGLPEAERQTEGMHATFRVRRKAFVYFLDNHHGDGKIGACVKADRRESAALIKEDPKRFFLPAYIGARGWIAMRLDIGCVDWKGLAGRVVQSYQTVAPKSLAFSHAVAPRAASRKTSSRTRR
jgi:hypothetical protein